MAELRSREDLWITRVLGPKHKGETITTNNYGMGINKACWTSIYNFLIAIGIQVC